MMTNDTPQHDPPPAPPAAAPPTFPGKLARPPKQAVWPNVIGVIGIIYAIGSILMAGWQMASTAFFDLFKDFMPANAGPNPFEAMAQWMPVLIVVSIAVICVAVLLLVASLGLITHKPWSRLAMLVWCVLKILVTLASAVVGMLMQRSIFAETGMQNPGIPPSLQEGLIIITFAFTVLFYSALPVFLLIWLNLKKPKAEVAKWREAAASAG